MAPAFVNAVPVPARSAAPQLRCTAFSGAKSPVAAAPARAAPRMTIDKFMDELTQTANAIAAPGKGILAVDESTKTIGKRLASIGVENTEANRQAYRGLLFNCPDLGQYISGAILFEETLYQDSADGKPFVDCLNGVGVIPGIKVDKGLQPLFGQGAAAFETWCTGLDGLNERAAAYYKQGARYVLAAQYTLFFHLPLSSPYVSRLVIRGMLTFVVLSVSIPIK